MRTVPYALALAAALATTAPAGAAGCPLVPDVAGDAIVATLDMYSPNLDLVGVDVASGPTTVVAVIRVVSLDPDLATTTGAQWSVGWRIDGVQHMVHALRDATGTWKYGKIRGGNPVTPYSVTADIPNATITLTIPRTAFPALATPGKTFTSITGTSNARLATPALLWNFSADTAAAPTTTYVDGTTGCVPAA